MPKTLSPVCPNVQEEWAAQVRGLWGDLADEEGVPQLYRGERSPDTKSMHGAAQVCRGGDGCGVLSFEVNGSWPGVVPVPLLVI